MTIDFIQARLTGVASVSRSVSFGGTEYIKQARVYYADTQASTRNFDFAAVFPTQGQKLSYFNPLLTTLDQSTALKRQIEMTSVGISPEEAINTFLSLGASRDTWGKVGRGVIWGIFGAAGAAICLGSGILLCAVGGGAAAFDASVWSDIFTDWYTGGGGNSGKQTGAQGGQTDPSPPIKEKKDKDQ